MPKRYHGIIRMSCQKPVANPRRGMQLPEHQLRETLILSFSKYCAGFANDRFPWVKVFQRYHQKGFQKLEPNMVSAVVATAVMKREKL